MADAPLLPSEHHKSDAERLVDDDRNTPTDKFHAVKIIMALLGMGVLLPWNMVTSAGDYFNGKFPGRNPMFLIPLLYNLPAVPTMLVMLGCGGKFSCFFSTRLLLTFFFDAVILVCIPLVPVVFPNVEAAFVIVLCLATLFGCITSVMQSSVFAFAGQLPQEYVGAVMFGNGIAGIAATALSMITQGVLPNTDKGKLESAIMYFSIGCVILIVCGVSYIFLVRHEFAIHHLKDRDVEVSDADGSYGGMEVGGEKDEDPMHPPAGAEGGNKALSTPFRGSMLAEKQRLAAARGASEEDGALAPETPRWRSASEGRCPAGLARLLKVFSAVWIESLTVFAVFGVSLALFPGLFFVLPYRGAMGDAINDTWWHLILVMGFNVFDTLGRTLPKYARCIPRKALLVPTVLRLAFVPLFVCSVLYPVFNDWIVLFIVVVFSVSNGYLSTLGMMYGAATGNTLSDDERGLAGLVTSTALQCGIFVGLALANVFSTLQPVRD